MVLCCLNVPINRKCVRLFYLFCASLLVCIIFKVVLSCVGKQKVNNRVLCSEVIQSMCSDVRNNLIAGNLCSRLCQGSLSQYQCIRLAAEGKTVIIFNELDGKKVVLKTKSLDTHSSAPSYIQPKDYETVEDAESFLTKISEAQVTSQQAFKQLLSHIALYSSNVKAALSTATSLLSQNEYVTLLELQNTYTVPTLYGACGNFYGTEYTPTDKVLLVNNLWSGFPWTASGPWEQRRSAAIAIIELVDRLDNLKRSFCDVKGDNFGFLDDGRAVLLDVDTLFKTKELGETLKMDSCTSNSDCSFWDCHGKCDLQARTCTPELSNTNFHAVCQKIFAHHSSNAYHGLLTDTPDRRHGISQYVRTWCSGWSLTDLKSKEVMKFIRKELVHDRILG